jgi:tellurite resistance protein TehA-like permease
MTAMWLLPVVTLIVAASSGGVLGRALLNFSPYFALITIVVATFLVITGLSLALMILTIYLFRLVVYGLPQGGTILSVFLPLGPTGQSGYAILLIGQTLKNLLPYNPASQFLHSKVTGDVIEVVCICAAFLLWSLATMWMFYALLALQASLRQNRVPFNLSFWGLVFPNVRICVFLASLASRFIHAFIHRVFTPTSPFS